MDCPDGLDISQAVDSDASSASLTYLHPPPAAMPGQATARELAARTLHAQPSAAELTPRTPRVMCAPQMSLTRHFLDQRAGTGAAVHSSDDLALSGSHASGPATPGTSGAAPGAYNPPRPGVVAVPRRQVDAPRLLGRRVVEPSAELADDATTVRVSPYNNVLYGDTTLLDSTSLPLISASARAPLPRRSAYSAGTREPVWRPGLEPLQAMASPPLSAEAAALRTPGTDANASSPVLLRPQLGAPHQSQLKGLQQVKVADGEQAVSQSHSAAMLAAPAAQAWKSLRSGVWPSSGGTSPPAVSARHVNWSSEAQSIEARQVRIVVCAQDSAVRMCTWSL